MGKKPKAEFPNFSPETLKSLVGSTPETPNSTPVRPKPTADPHPIPPNLREFLQLDVDSPAKSAPHIPKSIKRKRSDSKLHSPDSAGPEIELAVKKSRIGIELVSKSSNLGGRKRKRGEVEAEYEGRKHRGAGLNCGEQEGGKGKVGEKRKKVERGEDMLVAQEGFDDEERLLRTVFVGNLPLKVKKKALLREFGRFGAVESVRIRPDETIKKKVNEAVGRANAYVVFESEDSARASLSHNMAIVGGNHIRVERACPPRKKPKGENAPLRDSQTTVFVGNLPVTAKTVVSKHKRKGTPSADDDSAPAKRAAVDGKTGKPLAAESRS